MYVQASLLDHRRYRHYKFSREIEAQMKALSATDNWHSPLALLIDYGMIFAAALACLYISWWLYPLAVVLIGARQRGVSSILHESSHGVSAKSAMLRGVLGTVLTAYPIFQTFYAYKISHVLTHHPQLGRRDLDADLQFFIDEDVFKPVPPRRYFWRMMVLPQLGLRTFAYFKYLLKNRLSADDGNDSLSIPADMKRRRRLEYVALLAFWLIVVAIAYYFDALLYLLLFWVVPYLTYFQIIGWYIELTEHCTVIGGQQTDLFMTSNRHSRGFERFLTGIHNDHHHLDHHLNPSIPFWNLPKARQIQLQDPEYARVDRNTGGLFTRGFSGAPSALRRLLDLNRKRYETLQSVGAVS